ncbi:MAG: hypothetical protein KDD66_10465 [Bdellovibrionales bacterium]|nr:hypothetical protein [Bdellovibrionales bacterium]
MLWLKQFDGAAKFFPKGLLRRLRLPASVRERPCLVRPGGLGDLVILTRALIELGVSPTSVDWLVEKRNAIWLDYLGVDYMCYDAADTVLFGLAGLNQYSLVINTEQTFGLSALLAGRMTAADGKLVGLESNRRSDCYDLAVDYPQDELELISFKRLVEHAAVAGGGIEQAAFRPPPAKEGQASSHVVVAVAGLQAKYKSHSMQTWCEIVKKASEYDSLVYLVGAPADRTFAVELQHRCGVQVRNQVGVAPFPRTVDLVRTAKMLFSVDSGLVHVADFFGVPSQAVFKGGNPKKWRPTAEGSSVLNSKLEPLNLDSA